MSTPMQGQPRPADSLNPTVDLAEWLPALLSVIAGMVDVLSFLTLKLFAAHVTGNLVVIAALLARGGQPNIPQILAVPVFIFAVGVAWLIAKVSRKRGPALGRLLLLVQLFLLICVLVLAVIFDPLGHPHGFMGDTAAMIAVAAMACQFSLLRLAIPGAPSTAVMTGNLTKTVLLLLESAWRKEPLISDARKQLKGAPILVIGFFVGCLTGAAALSWVGDWAWSLPVALAGAALAFVPRKSN